MLAVIYFSSLPILLVLQQNMRKSKRMLAGNLIYWNRPTHREKKDLEEGAAIAWEAIPHPQP
jgi:hypothetical protein